MAREPLNVLLFDIDGVLVDPRGYRAAVFKTLQFMLDEMGVGDRTNLLPTEDDIDYMEACGVHDVWDITNIFYRWMLCIAGKDRLSAPNYHEIADAIKSDLQNSNAHPPTLAWPALAAKYRSLHPESKEAMLDQMKEPLEDSRSVEKSWITRLFQNIVLGSAEFEKTYQMESRYKGDSLLSSEDRLHLLPTHLKQLRSLMQSDPNSKIAIYTARPSHPPAGVSYVGFSPEAELAARLAGLDDLPLVGMGSMEWLAAQRNCRSEELVKPNTTQAAAALIAAARGKADMQTLNDAYEVTHATLQPECSAGGTPAPAIELADLKARAVTIWVFEDTTSGVKPMIKVAELLNSQLGCSITVKPLGISRNASKTAALQPLCCAVFPSVNDAIDFVVPQITKAVTAGGGSTC